MKLTITFYYAFYSTGIRKTLPGTNIKNIKHETGQNSRNEHYKTTLMYSLEETEIFKDGLLKSLENIRQSPSLKSCLLDGGKYFEAFYLDHSFHIKLTKANRNKIVIAIEKLLRHRAMYPNFYKA